MSRRIRPIHACTAAAAATAAATVHTHTATAYHTVSFVACGQRDPEHFEYLSGGGNIFDRWPKYKYCLLRRPLEQPSARSRRKSALSSLMLAELIKFLFHLGEEVGHALQVDKRSPHPSLILPFYMHEWLFLAPKDSWRTAHTRDQALTDSPTCELAVDSKVGPC